MNRLHLTIVLAAALCAPVLQAADYGSPAPRAKATNADPLGAARSLIGQSRWSEAIDELKRVNQPQSADWNNLMGYSHRKQPAPDLTAAQQYYDAALRIDPKHRGALEYSGELMLMKNDVAGARSRLSSLESVCAGSCVELTQLKTAIASHEAKPRTP